MTSWQPDPTGLAKIIHLLHGGNSTDNIVQRCVQQELQHLSVSVPEYPCYLVYILSPASNQQPDTRVMAGYALKSYLITHLPHILDMILSYIKSNLLMILGDSDDQVNRVTGTLIAFLLAHVKTQNWPDAPRRLAELLSSVDHDHPSFLAALSTLYKAVEDDADDLISSPSQPLASLLPLVIQFVSSPREKLAVLAISIMTELVHGETPLIEQSMDAFLPALFARAMDQSSELRKAVCVAICRVLENRSDKLEPLLNDVIKYMLTCTQSYDDDVALEACEFWLVLGESDTYVETLGSHLNQLVPILLQRMVYSKLEILELGGDEDDAHIPDSDQEIKPRHYRGKSSTSDVPVPTSSTGTSDNGHITNGGTDDNNSIEDDDNDDEDDDSDVANSWTIRKCAAATLDMIAGIYQNEIFDVLLPELNQRLSSTDWLVRESGVLALGAVAEGCMEGMIPHLPQLVPYLLTMVTQDKALVRSIVCWTLGRYAHWILSAEKGGIQYLPRFVEVLMTNCVHRNKKVQEASCSALATLEEAAGSAIAPYLPQILPILARCINEYQKKNLVVLYDCIGTLAESLHNNELRDTNYAQLIIEPLMKKFHEVPDLAQELLPLFESLAAVAIATGMTFAPHAKTVMERSLQLIHQTYLINEEAKTNSATKEPEPDYYIVALDLMGGIVSGLGTSSETLVQPFITNIMDALKLTLSHPLPAVRQSALGLFGDLVINSYIHVKPYTHDLLATAIPLVQLVEERSWMRLTNNAVWVCAELTARMGTDMVPYASQLWDRIIGILCNHYRSDYLPPMLADNCALAAGRLGHVSPNLLAKDLNRFGPIWCHQMSMTREGPEKEASFLGFLKVLQINPNAMVPHLPRLIEAILHYVTISSTTEDAFQQILSAYKSMLGEEQWQQIMLSMPPQAIELLSRRFQV